MDNIQLLLAVLIAAGIPLLFLWVIYLLDLYASRSFRLVALCFVWGTGGGMGLAYLLNSYVTVPLLQEFRLDRLLLFILFAPIVEEVIKPLPLLYVVRHPRFTYFVDGAIYGFAAGIGFSITESFLYISQRPEVAIPLALARAFTTCLMQGSATALIGAAVGRFRLLKSSELMLRVVGTAIISMTFHGLFNLVVLASPVTQSIEVLAAMVIGMCGVVTIAVFIYLGLQEQQKWLSESLDLDQVALLRGDLSVEEQRWLDETLDQEAGVSFAEVRASQSLQILDEILAPVAEQFPEQTELMRQIVLNQAQIGIRRRLLEQATQAEPRERLSREIKRLEGQTKILRREVGMCAVIFLKNVFDPEHDKLGPALEQLSLCLQSNEGRS